MHLVEGTGSRCNSRAMLLCIVQADETRRALGDFVHATVKTPLAIVGLRVKRPGVEVMISVTEAVCVSEPLPRVSVIG